MKQPKPKICPCGVKFTPRGIQKYHSPACELSFKTGKVNPKDELKLPLQVIRSVATGTFQDYVKQRDFEKGCYTCPTKTGMFHAGHYFKKELFSGMIFSELSTRKQCDHCNVGLDGNLEVYKNNLIKELGIEAFIELENESITTKSYRWSKIEFIEITATYKAKILELKTQKNNALPPVFEVTK